MTRPSTSSGPASRRAKSGRVPLSSQTQQTQRAGGRYGSTRGKMVCCAVSCSGERYNPRFGIRAPSKDGGIGLVQCRREREQGL